MVFSTHTRQAGEDPSTTTQHIGYSQLHWLRVIPGSLKHKATIPAVHLYMKLQEAGSQTVQEMSTGESTMA